MKMFPEAMSTWSCCSVPRLAGSVRSAFWLSHNLCSEGARASKSGRSSRPASLRNLNRTPSKEVRARAGQQWWNAHCGCALLAPPCLGLLDPHLA